MSLGRQTPSTCWPLSGVRPRTYHVTISVGLVFATVLRAQSANPAPRQLPTAWTPPPGQQAHHEAAGFAKVLCSAVFITGRDSAASAREDGYFVSPLASRRALRGYTIDRERRSVRVTTAEGSIRQARQIGSQGCVTLPEGSDTVTFTPERVEPAQSNRADRPWPLGDILPSTPLPATINVAKLNAAMDAAFADPEGLTAAVVVLYKGQLIAERYAPGVTDTTRLPGWSMGKSVTATLIGRLIQLGALRLTDRAPVKQWSDPSDPRHRIRLIDILRMSSGLRLYGPFDPDYNAALGYADHLYVYTGAIDAQRYAITRPPQWLPNTVGRYRNTDPLSLNYIIRQTIAKRGESYLSWPQRNLFDALGIRHFTIETDVSGGFLLQGYELGAARDWARLAQLTLNDGMWNGARLLPKGWLDVARTPARAWPGLEYGGMWWLNRKREFPVPEDAFYMAGVGGQFNFVVPTHDLVITRLGHFKGAEKGEAALKRAMVLLMEAVPQQRAVWRPR
jgi:CubicO group peptidase (beta-lactamase class C family)